MKTFLFPKLSLITLLSLSLSLLNSAPSIAAESENPSNVDGWDCLISGGKYNGIAFIVFSNNFTLHGYEMLVPKASSDSTSLRGGSGTRGGSSPGNTNAVLFGFGPISGVWHFDAKNNLVGSFVEAVEQAQNITNYVGDCTSTNITVDVVNSNGVVEYQETTSLAGPCLTNATFETNFIWTIVNTNDFTTNFYSQDVIFTVTNFTVGPGEPIDVLNSVSFKGKATGSRLTLVGTSPAGHFAYRGVTPLFNPLQDLTGSWVGVRTQGGQELNEFFDLHPFTTDNPFISFYPDLSNFSNVYFTTNGVGTGYTVNMGLVMLSAQNKIGFTFVESPIATSSTSIRTTIGALPRTGSTVRTKGTIDGFTPVRFDATLP